MTEEHDDSLADEKSISTPSEASPEPPEALADEAPAPDEETVDEAQALVAAPVEVKVEAADSAPSPEPPPAAEEAAPDTTDETGTATEPDAQPVAEAAPQIEVTRESADDFAALETAPAPATPVAPPRQERPEVTALRAAQENKETVEGKIIGWNNGGLHVVVNGITAFCPRSEIEIGSPKGPEAYLDKELPFLVLRVQKRGRRIVLSRRALLQGDRDEKLDTLRTAMRAGNVLEGKVSSVTDFGAFVDLGGIDGLIHVSEISRTRVSHASEALSEGDSVKVRVLKISDDGTRVSLSAKALEPDPWDGVEDRFPAGDVVKGTVERTVDFGAFVEIAPGLTGLLPTSAMNLPRDASPARVYQPGKEISVQILSVDRRRRRISLALEGSQVEGTRADLKTYLSQQGTSESSFGSLAAAFEKAKKRS